MKITAIGGNKTIGIWAIVCILVILSCVLVSLIGQEAYAETKKISGTLKSTTTATNTIIRDTGKTPIKSYKFLLCT